MDREMKSRNCFGAFIGACLLGASSFSQIQNGKFVFQNETCVTGYSAHIFMDVNLADARAAANVMLQEIINNWALNLKSQVVIYENIDALRKDILGRNVDIIVVTTPEYLMLRNQVNITPFMTYKIEDQILDRMLLVSRIDSGIRSIIQLKGRKIAVYTILNDELDLPKLWFTTLVLKSGGNFRNEYASSVYEVRKGNTAISDVFFRKADAAVVTERNLIISRELNPQIGAQLSVIDSSKYMLYSVLCYTEKMTTSLNRYKDRNLQSVADLLCNTNKTEIGKHLLSVFRVTSFIPFESEYLKDTEALFNDFKTLSTSKNRHVK
jgi:ABC-type phosphate/phosphonate transport system substrate-binding protein